MVSYRSVRYSVRVDPAVKFWQGGQGFRWDDSPLDEIRVTSTDGYGAGFALFGSDEVHDQLTAMSGNQPLHEFLTLGVGTWLISTRTYEKYTLASRTIPPLIPLVYAPNEPLYFSLRGLWTKEDEWTLSLDPRAPSPVVARVQMPPSLLTDDYLSLHTALLCLRSLAPEIVSCFTRAMCTPWRPTSRSG